jgi:hypothetical protein
MAVRCSNLVVRCSDLFYLKIFLVLFFASEGKALIEKSGGVVLVLVMRNF